ncbi:MAG: trehalose-phosphatase [Gemmatimonadales bacterium]
MTVPGRGAVATLARAHRRGSTVALFLDYDGTLARIARRPDLAVLPASRRRLLTELSCLPRVTVGVVSGRALAELRRLVAIRGIYYAGTGGMEIDLPGRRVHHPAQAACRRIVARAGRLTATLPRRWPGAWIEPKPIGITVHFRDVERRLRPALLSALHQALGPIAPHLHLMYPRDAVEILPRAGWDKGSAVRIMLRDIRAASVVPCYAGDDVNDVHAFEAALTAGGIAIGVGSRAPEGATYHVAGPGALDRLLQALRRAISSSRAPRRSPSSAHRTPTRRPR